MATSRRGVRRTRKLRQWTVEQVESGQFPGVVWDDPPHKTMFRIPWKHAGKQEFRHEEDAGFFKAWAIFKGKYRPGEPLDPATWKTRIRCAFSKSPEFEEVPERSKLGTAEPYKVYRLVPLPEQRLGTPPRKPKTSRPEPSSGSSEKENGDPQNSVPQSPAAVCSLKTELSHALEAISSQAQNAFAALVVPHGETNPQPMEAVAPAVNEVAAFHQNPEPPQAAPISEIVNGGQGDFFFILSVSYGGKVVLKHILPDGEFLVTSAAPRPGTSVNSMRRVVLPPASMVEDPRKEGDICRLLADLEKGIMVASNAEGIFVQCRGRASIFCHGPWGTQPHEKLASNTFLHLFSTKAFKSALQEFHLGREPKPEHRVTLCVGEELGHNCVDSKLIVIQMEQLFASAAVSPPVVPAAPPQDLLVISDTSAEK